ncbi:MAG: hypothetical protein ACYDCK_13315 [Thermoplasmatota archaeon]
MGFSVTASVVILALGAFTMGSVLGGALFSSWDRLDASARDDWTLRLDALRTNVTVTSEAWDGTAHTITLDLRNSGATVLDPTHAEFVVDGAWKTDKATSLTVNGASTTVWTPGDTLVAVLTDAGWASAPKCIEVVTGNGVATFWRDGC